MVKWLRLQRLFLEVGEGAGRAAAALPPHPQPPFKMGDASPAQPAQPLCFRYFSLRRAPYYGSRKGDARSAATLCHLTSCSPPSAYLLCNPVHLLLFKTICACGQ